MKDVCVVLPTYNEAGTIRELLAALERSMVGLSIRVVVVDDGSKDGTLGILREMMERHGNIILVERGRKLGLGTAIIDGFKTALSLEPEPEFIVTMDADLSHDPGELPSLVEACDGDTVVIGSRYVENGEIHGWGPYRKMVSAVANFFVRAFTDINARDCTSGFRCYSASLVRAVLP
ncbi:MAG: glycosyltransferase, partial [Candidatus Bathyarchaeota archaeon]|nr:glycosyltransferase [Candidatus Bathyarchaeota archaeon]